MGLSIRSSSRVLVALSVLLGCKPGHTRTEPNNVWLHVESHMVRITARINDLKTITFPEYNPLGDNDPSDPLYKFEFSLLDEREGLWPWINPGENVVSIKVENVTTKSGRAKIEILQGRFGPALSTLSERSPGQYELRFSVPAPKEDCIPVSPQEDREIRAREMALIHAFSKEDWTTVQSIKRRYEEAPLGNYVLRGKKEDMATLNRTGGTLDVPTAEGLRLRRDCWDGTVWVDRHDEKDLYSGVFRSGRMAGRIINGFDKMRKIDGQWYAVHFQ